MAKQTNIWRGSIDQFCTTTGKSPAELSRCVGMKDRQQIYNYIKSTRVYIVEMNQKNGDVRIIRAETVVNEGKLQ